ncbi:MAG: hypothetical protein IT168_33365 [Bryobacterales bacterium]|nr:hypothetical protein [Bryobacterales bacterium]
MCPGCGSDLLVDKTCVWIETHGLDCGPYETGTDEWFECRNCGAKLAPSEVVWDECPEYEEEAIQER